MREKKLMADMICPRAKECDRPQKKNCGHKVPHKFLLGCDTLDEDECPDCIRIPSPSPTEPDIPHTRVPRTATTNLVVSQVDEPAPQPCCPEPSSNYNCPTCDYKERQVSRGCDTIKAMRDALRWCSGSADFQEGGQARKGWLKICKPLL